MKIELCDLKRQYQLLKDKIDTYIQRVLEHARFIDGPEIEELEERLCQFIGVRYSIGVSSGTDALILALISLGVKSGDFVITTPFTFPAPAEAVSLLGAIPIFVDIREDTFNIDPEKIKEFLKSPFHPYLKGKVPLRKLKAIISVDLFGQCADYDSISDIARRYSLSVIEDAAQALGAEYKERKAGSLTDVGCTSFFPAKPLGCFGDGGAIFTNDRELAKKIRCLRNHGQAKKYKHLLPGLNARLDTLQAGVLLAKLDTFISQEIALREKIARRYLELLAPLQESGKIILPHIESFNRPVWAQFSIKVLKARRDELRDYLSRKGVPSAIHYPKALHLQKAFSYLGYRRGSFPQAEKISSQIMSLPFYPYLKEEELKYICRQVLSFFGVRKKF